MKAVILAGGKGTRLAPYTTVLPKPLMPIGEKPILDIVIRQMISNGFNDIILSVGYLAELIMAYCGDGRKYGVKLRYIKEDKPLGTAGPISLIPELNETFLLINGDILTTLNYSRLWKFHKRNKGLLTLAIQKRSVKIDFGVIDSLEINKIKRFVEKPVMEIYVGMGICVLEPEVQKYIQYNKKIDMPEVINRLLDDKKPVYAYISRNYWADIGRPDDYKRAVEDFTSMKYKFLK